jgi:hypothetical protein
VLPRHRYRWYAYEVDRNGVRIGKILREQIHEFPDPEGRRWLSEARSISGDSRSQRRFRCDRCGCGCNRDYPGNPNTRITAPSFRYIYLV